MVNRRLCLFLTLLLAGISGHAFAADSNTLLQLDQSPAGDLLLYNADSGVWLAARYSTGQDPFEYRTGVWGSGLTVVFVRLNGDALADAVLYDRETGEFATAINNGSGFDMTPGRWARGWTVHRANFNGDGLDDLLLSRRDTGELYQAINDGAGRFSLVAGSGPAGREIIPADFDGDGRSDLFTYNPATGAVALLIARLDGSGFTRAQAGTWAPGWKISAATLNPDGRSDLFLYHPETGAWFQCLSIDEGGGFRFTAGKWAPGRKAVIGDFDADGLDDVLLYDFMEGGWDEYTADGSGGFRRIARGAWSADASLFVTDFNRDGRSDLMLYNRRDGRFGVALTLAGGGFEYRTGWWSTNWAIGSQLGDRLESLRNGGPGIRAPGGPSPGPTLPSPRLYLSTPRILAFGDSITEGSDGRGATLAADDEGAGEADEIDDNTAEGIDEPQFHASYPSSLDSLLRGQYPGQTSLGVTNEGRSGELVADGKNRVGPLIDNLKPDLVLVLEGVNDINNRSPAQIGDDIRILVERALGRGVKVLLSRLTPVTSAYDPSGATQVLIENVNGRIDTIASQLNIGPSVDAYNDLRSNLGLYMSGDGLHPSDSGYAQLARTFQTRIVSQYGRIAKPVVLD